uniref:Hexosyltransferase n=1 Tax=Meloidogyne javanica TaxID=6303 RepID=A0A915MP36_MELJA
MLLNIEISHSKALTPEKTDLKQKEEKLEIDQKDYETIDIDAEPITENFGVIAYEEFPFPTDNLFISFKNLKINYTIILPTPNGICPQKTKMFVFVPSRADGFYTRHMIRNSWGANLAERSIVLKFIVGWPQEQKVFELMQEELIKYDDLVVYDIDDSYRNLYLKIYVALQWQQIFCSTAQYILKTDDDTIVDFDRLLWWIDNDFGDRVSNYPAAVFGGMIKRSSPIRNANHRWYVSPIDFPHPIFPHYTNGPTYLLTSKAVQAIMNLTENVHAFPIEDVLYTGVLANLANVKKFSIWEHFRIGKHLNLHEKCKVEKKTGKRIPYVTAINGISDASGIKIAYERLHSVECTPWSSSKQMKRFSNIFD